MQVKHNLQKMGALQPMTIFLRQEIDRMQRVIKRVRTTLIDLKLAIDGEYFTFVLELKECLYISDIKRNQQIKNKTMYLFCNTIIFI